MTLLFEGESAHRLRSIALLPASTRQTTAAAENAPSASDAADASAFTPETPSGWNAPVGSPEWIRTLYPIASALSEDDLSRWSSAHWCARERLSLESFLYALAQSAAQGIEIVDIDPQGHNYMAAAEALEQARLFHSAQSHCVDLFFHPWTQKTSDGNLVQQQVHQSLFRLGALLSRMQILTSSDWTVSGSPLWMRAFHSGQRWSARWFSSASSKSAHDQGLAKKALPAPAVANLPFGFCVFFSSASEGLSRSFSFDDVDCLRQHRPWLDLVELWGGGRLLSTFSEFSCVDQMVEHRGFSRFPLRLREDGVPLDPPLPSEDRVYPLFTWTSSPALRFFPQGTPGLPLSMAAEQQSFGGMRQALSTFLSRATSSELSEVSKSDAPLSSDLHQAAEGAHFHHWTQVQTRRQRNILNQMLVSDAQPAPLSSSAIAHGASGASASRSCEAKSQVSSSKTALTQKTKTSSPSAKTRRL